MTAQQQQHLIYIGDTSQKGGSLIAVASDTHQFALFERANCLRIRDVSEVDMSSSPEWINGRQRSMTICMSVLSGRLSLFSLIPSRRLPTAPAKSSRIKLRRPLTKHLR